jgi:hypothetical protein
MMPSRSASDGDLNSRGVLIVAIKKLSLLASKLLGVQEKATIFPIVPLSI